MTPKDKAQELFNKFKNELDWIEKDYTVDLYRDIRKCALIAVDEIWSLLESSKQFNYWSEVKEEIEKL